MCAGLVAACAAVYCALVALAKCVGGSVEGGAERLLQLLAWAVATVQMVGQVSSAAVAGSPASIRGLYAALAVFQLNGIVVPSACLFSAPPFAMETASCAAPLALLVAGAVALALGHTRSAGSRGPVAQTLFDTATTTPPALPVCLSKRLQVMLFLWLLLARNGAPLLY